MTATFAPMAKAQHPGESDLKKVSVTGKVPQEMEDILKKFGRELRSRNVTTHGDGGKSNALDAILEMARYLEWFENPDDFADKLFEFRKRPRK